MYTATITKKEILEQHQFILLTIELKSDTPIPRKKDKDGKEVPEYVMGDDGQPKLGKDGKPKLKKKNKQKFPTKTIYFKFPIDTTWTDMKAQIKTRIDQIEKCESEEIPMNTPLDFST